MLAALTYLVRTAFRSFSAGLVSCRVRPAASYSQEESTKTLSLTWFTDILSASLDKHFAIKQTQWASSKSYSPVYLHIPYHTCDSEILTLLQESNSTNWSSATLAVSTAAHSTMSTTSTENTSTAMRCVHRPHHPSRSTPQAASGNRLLGVRPPGNQPSVPSS